MSPFLYLLSLSLVTASNLRIDSSFNETILSSCPDTFPNQKEGDCYQNCTEINISTCEFLVKGIKFYLADLKLTLNTCDTCYTNDIVVPWEE